MQAQMKQGFLRDNWLSLLVGFGAGLYHVGVFVFLSAGTGGSKHGGTLLSYVFFGYGSLVWSVLPPISTPATPISLDTASKGRRGSLRCCTTEAPWL
jgi:hypothetical protein